MQAEMQPRKCKSVPVNSASVTMGWPPVEWRVRKHEQVVSKTTRSGTRAEGKYMLRSRVGVRQMSAWMGVW